MKNALAVKISGGLERDAIRLLRDVPGVIVEPTPPSDEPDLIIQVGGLTHLIEVKAQPRANAADAQQLIAYAQRFAGPRQLVVVAHTITEDARDRLAEAGIGFLDATGAKFLDLPGLYVWTEGAAAKPASRGTRDAPGVRLAGKAGVATEALLQEPDRNWRIQDLAAEANVSSGLVHRLFLRLEREGLVVADGAGPRKARRVVRPGSLLDLWAEEMGNRGVRQLRAYRLARDPRTQASTLSRALHDASINHAVTGAAAAARLAPFVTAVPITEVWVTELTDLHQAAEVASANPVEDGHNVIFRSAKDDAPLMFRQLREDVWLAGTFRVYLDLRRDPRRGREQAGRLREEVIGF